MNKSWYYDNYRILPRCAPHQIADEDYITSGQCWKDFSTAICATYTSSFDISEKEPWWYVIKDAPFDLSKLNAKRRYEITKGNRNFEVTLEERPLDYKDELYAVYKESISTGYKGENFKMISFDDYCKWLGNMSIQNERGGVNRFFVVRNKNNKIGGYGHIIQYPEWGAFSTMKTLPRYEKEGVNAALVYGVLEYLKPYLEQDDFYFSDGSRTIFHKTAFQDYLQKYFQFRKAYSKLEIAYNPRFGWIIKMLYPFRSIIERCQSIHHSFRGLASMLKLEECHRACKGA